MPGEDVQQAVIALVARVLVERSHDLGHRDRCRPRLREGRRIVDRDLVVHRTGTESREALDDATLLAGAIDSHVSLVDVGEIDRLNDERIAFPVAARVAQPLFDAGPDVRTPVHRNDPRVVNHLDENHDVAGHLQDLIVMVVEARHHRARQTTRDAPLVGTAIPPRVSRAGAPRCPLPFDHPLRHRRQRGKFSVRWIDEQRRPVAGQCVAGLEPDARGVPGPGACLKMLVGSFRFVFRAPVINLLFVYSSLLIGQKLFVAQISGSFQARRGHVVPDALDVGVAPRRTRQRPRLVRVRGRRGLADRGHWRQRHDGDQRDQRNEKSIPHLTFSLLDRFSCSSARKILFSRDFRFACPEWHVYTPDRRRSQKTSVVAQSSSFRGRHLSPAAIERAIKLLDQPPPPFNAGQKCHLKNVLGESYAVLGQTAFLELATASAWARRVSSKS